MIPKSNVLPLNHYAHPGIRLVTSQSGWTGSAEWTLFPPWGFHVPVAATQIFMADLNICCCEGLSTRHTDDDDPYDGDDVTSLFRYRDDLEYLILHGSNYTM